jgi:carbon-monoxide dehydrogenase medium subunit
MKPAPFTYHHPATIGEAIALLERHENAKLLAGGQSLMPMLNMRYAMPDHVVDLNDVDGLAGIELRGGELHVGAMTRQRELEFSALVAAHCPLLPEAVRNVGHRQTRNRGTLGGSLCHLDPSAELPAVAMAMDAVISVQGKGGERRITMPVFAAGYMTPAIEPDEIVTGVSFPLWKKEHGYAFLEFARRHGDFAVVGVAVLLSCSANGRIDRSSIALCGMGPRPVRLLQAERLLAGAKPGTEIFSQAARFAREVDAMEDVHATRFYRRHLAGVLTERALGMASNRIAVGV